MKITDFSLAGLIKRAVENSNIHVLICSFSQTFCAGGLEMKFFDGITDNVMYDIINQLQIQPRANIVKMHFLEKKKSIDIARQLDLSESIVINQINLFRILLANSLQVESEETGPRSYQLL